ncbi:hypothetical protein KIH86_10990 [Paenibacillus sp. HN-1]|uniref:DUF6449 domain-containing protein n=1 Tax=Paenibacillus TaxID=44249 RepID=UPI001CA94613|nr:MULTISPECIES: DUF6449 domain-containing protein [Paenibacillus]MBY9077476.1 hypothetical protein [Paenibacillus sp. CGMCC 1.18879]MBY9084747.1 hypothetical protein [Paenibacillus sinensis]
MTSRRYFFNRGVIRQDVKQHSWISVIYLLGLLFSLPLQMLLTANPDNPARKITSLFMVNGSPTMLFTATLPVGAGLILFRYLQHKGAADAAHSLPLRRSHLLANHLASGAAMLLIPVWLTALAAGLLTLWSGNPFQYGASEVWWWGLSVSVVTLFLFVFTAFVGICIGQTVLQGVVVYILLILPFLLSQMVLLHLNLYLYGFLTTTDTSGVENWSLLIHMMNVYSRPFKGGEVSLYAVLTLVFAALSFVLYRKRSSETAGQAMAFTYFNPLFKGGVMLCAMLIAGTYFAQMRAGQIGWAFAGYALGALAGYIAAEMVIRKTWQIWSRSLPLRLTGYAAVIGVLLYVPVSPLTGFESRVPSPDKVAGVYAGGQYWQYFESRNRNENEVDTNLAHSPFDGVDPFVSDPGYISAVRKLHEAVVQTRPKENSSLAWYERSSISLTIVYELKDGTRLSRQYSVPVAGFEPELKAVIESKAYKDKEYVLDQLDQPNSRIELSSGLHSATIADEDMNEFRELLKQEISQMSFNDQRDDRTALANIQIYPDDSIGRSYSFNWYDWKPSYRKLGAWLEEKGYADRVLIKAKDVVSVELADLARIPPDILRNNNPESYLAEAKSQNQAVTVTDKTQISELLKLRRSLKPVADSCIIKVKLTNGNGDYFRISKAELPPGILN